MQNTDNSYRQENRRIKKLPGNRYMDLLTDYGFKYLFGNENQKSILLSFLNTILEGERVIIDLRYDPLDHSGDTEETRKITIDLLCTTNVGEQIIIEVQRVKQDFFRERCIFYTSRLINEQLPKGQVSDDYQLKPVYLIAFLDFTFSNESEKKNDGRYIRNFCLSDKETGEVFYNKLQYKFVELPKFVKGLEELNSDLDEWLYLLRHMPELKEQPQEFNGTIFDQVF